MKKVSVIIPVYNVEPFLERCVDSVLNQSYSDIEILLIDDGSPDQCPQICDRYADSYSNIEVIHQLNGGLSKARNAGIKKASGEYLFFLDSDDYLDKECISKLIENSAEGILATIGYKLDIVDKKIISNVRQAYGNYHSIKEFLNDFNKTFATKFNFAWGKLYDTHIIREQKLLFEDGVSLVEDVLFNLQYYRFCRGINLINYDAYYYCQHGATTLSKKFDHRMLEWNNRSFNAIRQFLIDYNSYDTINRLHLLNNAFGNFMYDFRLAALNTQMNRNAKIHIITEGAKLPIYNEAYKSQNKLRVDTRLFSKLIINGQINLYVFLEQLKYKLRHRK